jgi:hypothetical protein
VTPERRAEIQERLGWGWRDWYEKVLNRQSADWDAHALAFFGSAAEELLEENTRLRDLVDYLFTLPEPPAVVAVRILARLGREVEIPGDERLVAVVMEALAREGEGG